MNTCTSYTIQDTFPPTVWYCLIQPHTPNWTTSVPRYSAPSSTFRSRSLQFLRMQPAEGWEISMVPANHQAGFCNLVDPKRLGWNYVSQDPTQWGRQLEDSLYYTSTVLCTIRYPWYNQAIYCLQSACLLSCGQYEINFLLIIVLHAAGHSSYIEPVPGKMYVL